MYVLQPSSWRKPTYKELGGIGLSLGTLLLARYAWKKYNQHSLLASRPKITDHELELIEYMQQQNIFSDFTLKCIAIDKGKKIKNGTLSTSTLTGKSKDVNPVHYRLTTKGNQVASLECTMYESNNPIKCWQLTKENNSYIIWALNALERGTVSTMKNEFLQLLQVNKLPSTLSEKKVDNSITDSEAQQIANYYQQAIVDKKLWQKHLAEIASVGEGIIQAPLDAFPKYRFYINSNRKINTIVKYNSATDPSDQQYIDQTTVESINHYINPQL
jgi:hypothetical protein